MKPTQTTILIAAIIILVSAGVYLFGQKEDEERAGNNIAEYLQERIITLAIEDIGMPIEGFDAELVMAAFPGFLPSDFSGVETPEGHYELRGGELEFVRDQSQPITSAEGMISGDGYRTLLENVSARLEYAIDTREKVDALLSRLNTSERIRARIGEGASALGVRVVPLLVLEESRCPLDVTCIQAGTIRVRALLSSGMGEAPQEFTLDRPITTEAETVTLIQATPHPESGKTIAPSEYVFTFEATKR